MGPLRYGTTKTLAVSASTLKATLSGLPGTSFRIGVRAKNAAGWGNLGYSAYVTTKK